MARLCGLAYVPWLLGKRGLGHASATPASDARMPFESWREACFAFLGIKGGSLARAVFGFLVPEENPNARPKQSTEIQINDSNPNKTGHFAVAFVFYRPILSIYIH